MGFPTSLAAAAWARLWHHSEPRMATMVNAPIPNRFHHDRSEWPRPATQAMIAHTASSVKGNQVLPLTTTGVPKTCPTCGNNFLQKRYTQAKGEHLKCPQCKEEFAEDMTRVDELTTES